jgi:hypothetical protein
MPAYLRDRGGAALKRVSGYQRTLHAACRTLRPDHRQRGRDGTAARTAADVIEFTQALDTREVRGYRSETGCRVFTEAAPAACAGSRVAGS